MKVALVCLIFTRPWAIRASAARREQGMLWAKNWFKRISYPAIGRFESLL
ncbi:hypothetical protein BN341_5710 [Helicobacter heilmannii ASB1.4]|nr:hypothetical protein BN341_5710 [Helicobacter heilmannii ASB1.4]